MKTSHRSATPITDITPSTAAPGAAAKINSAKSPKGMPRIRNHFCFGRRVRELASTLERESKEVVWRLGNWVSAFCREARCTFRSIYNFDPEIPQRAITRSPTTLAVGVRGSRDGPVTAEALESRRPRHSLQRSCVDFSETVEGANQRVNCFAAAVTCELKNGCVQIVRDFVRCSSNQPIMR